MTLKIVCHFCQNLTGNLTSLTKMTFNFGDNGHKKGDNGHKKGDNGHKIVTKTMV